MDNDPDAALKSPKKIGVHLEGQSLAFPCRVAVQFHGQFPSCLLKATASA